MRQTIYDDKINAKEYAVAYGLDNRISKVGVDGNEVEYRYDAMENYNAKCYEGWTDVTLKGKASVI